MNGPHDMGGQMGFGPVAPEANEPVFHAEWERRVFAINLAVRATGAWNIDASRYARETFPATTYWSQSYYEAWLEVMIKLLQERGLATQAEIASGRVEVPPKPVNRVLKAAMVPASLAAGGPSSRTSNSIALFKVGDRVRARNIHPDGHTRLPRYARDKLGDIVAVHGAHVFPDSSAHGRGDDPRWLYTVRFTVRELWGKDAPDKVNIDLWEPYLEPA